MAETVARRGGKKNRKLGRHKTRSPAAARYRNENRSDRNKRRKIAKSHKPKVLAVPHGTARAQRRQHLQRSEA